MNGNGERPAHQARRRHEGVLHRRGRDARAVRHPPGDRDAASTSRLPGRRAAASRRCCRSSACSTRRPTARYTLNGKPVAEPEHGGARAHPQPRDRVHLPELQPDRRPDRLRERRAAAHLPRHEGGRAQDARRRGAREGRHGAPREAPPQPALGRSAAARRRGARAGRRARSSCSPTSRPATSTRGTARRSWTCCASCTAQGATICMVTHDPRFARHADRTHPPLRRPGRRGEHGGDHRVSALIAAPQRREVLPARRQPHLRAAADHRSTSAKASSSRSWGRRARASRRCCTSSGMLDSAWTGEYDFLDQPVHALEPEGARRAAQAVHRVRLPELPPARQPHGLREPRDPALLPRTSRGASAQTIVCDMLDRFQIVGQEGPLPEPALGRPAAARRRGARGHRQPEGDPRRRADRQPAHGAGPGDHGAVQAAQRRGDDDRPGHALGGERGVRRTGSSSCGTAGCVQADGTTVTVPMTRRRPCLRAS